jgi:hypothetical protein
MEIISGEVKKLIKSIGDTVTPPDIDSYERIQKIQDSSFRLRTILNAWEKQQMEERALRRRYASWLLIGLFIEVMIANVGFFFIGFGLINVSEWIANAFIVGVFGEIAAITLIVVRYLFPQTGKEILDMIQKL